MRAAAKNEHPLRDSEAEDSCAAVFVLLYHVYTEVGVYMTSLKVLRAPCCFMYSAVLLLLRYDMILEYRCVTLLRTLHRT